jgi:glycerol-3-phosphate acyltransferase PlsY
MVLLLDIIKGVLPVYFLGNFLLRQSVFLPGENLRLILGLACIAGHNWTIFLQFKGGKGIATTLGVLIGLAFNIPALCIVLVLVLAVWLVAFLISRTVSLASCLAALSLPILSICLHLPKLLILANLILCALAILRHRVNLARIFRGQEKKLL